MPSCMVDNCCGCIELRTGCLIIGYLELVLEIILLVMSMVGLMAGAAVANNSDNIEKRTLAKNVEAVSVVYLVTALVSLAITLLLLMGIYKNKRNYVKVYLIISVISLVVMTASFFASFAGTIEAQNIFVKILDIASSIYFIIVIRSYYYKMEELKPAILDSAAYTNV